MIDIDIQVKSFLFSLMFGFAFSFLLKVIFKFQDEKHPLVKTFMDFLFVIDNVLIYFVIMKKINNGIIHQYFVFCILLGFVVCEVILNKIKFTFKFNK